MSVETETPKELTYGQKRVGITFNPDQNEDVAFIKQLAAELIDHIKGLQNATTDNEQKRAYATAVTNIQTGQMWAVKGVFEHE